MVQRWYKDGTTHKGIHRTLGEYREHAKMSQKTKKPRKHGVFLEMFGGQGRDRTGDTRIFSPLLYQLSYLAPCVKMVGAQGFEPWTQ